MSLTTEQLLERRKGIGGSDVAAILGLSQWKTPIDVYNEKVNNEYPIATPRMRWGIRLENAIATEYKEQTGRKIRKCHKIIRHKKYPFLLGNIDRVIISGNGYGPGILEIKTASGFFEKTWQEEIPLYYFAQIQHYLFITGYTWGDIALLGDGRDFKIIPIKPDSSYIETALPILIDFWKNNILKLNPPEPTIFDDLNKLYPQEIKGKAIEISDDTYKIIQDLKIVKGQLLALNNDKKNYEQQIKIAMGDSEYLTFNTKPIVTWKQSKDSESIDIDRLKNEMPGIYDKYKIIKPGSRRLLLK